MSSLKSILGAVAILGSSFTAQAEEYKSNIVKEDLLVDGIIVRPLPSAEATTQNDNSSNVIDPVEAEDLEIKDTCVVFKGSGTGNEWGEPCS